MEEISYAAILIELTGIVSAFLGLFILLSKNKKQTAYGYSSFHAAYEVTDLKAYNKAVGKLWLVSGILVCILGTVLLLVGDHIAVWIAIAAIAVYVGGSTYYVTSITKRFRKEPSHDELWKDVK